MASDTTNGGVSGSNRQYPVNTSAGSITDTISAGASVDGFGLAFTNNLGGANTLNVVNDGAVQVDAGNIPSAGGSAALNISNLFATATNLNYSGTGTITNDDTPAISILELRAKARRLKASHDIQLLVLDYW